MIFLEPLANKHIKDYYNDQNNKLISSFSLEVEKGRKIEILILLILSFVIIGGFYLYQPSNIFIDTFITLVLTIIFTAFLLIVIGKKYKLYRFELVKDYNDLKEVKNEFDKIVMKSKSKNEIIFVTNDLVKIVIFDIRVNKYYMYKLDNEKSNFYVSSKN